MVVDLDFNQTMKDAREIFERAYVKTVLALYGNNVTKAAEHSGFSRASFHRKIRDLGITINRSDEDG